MYHAPDMPIIQIYEHGILRIGESYGAITFNEQHWKQLKDYQNYGQHIFYKVVHRGIKFNSYVGSIALNNLIVEVHPKADAHETSPVFWRKFLLEMMAACPNVTRFQMPPALMDHQDGPILLSWVKHFLTLTGNLVEQGLFKSYFQEESRQRAFRGKILFAKQRGHEVIHKERVYTRHHAYQPDSLLHAIIGKALDIVIQNAAFGHLCGLATSLKSHFPSIETKKIVMSKIWAIKYRRNNIHYQPIIQLAGMLLASQTSSFQTGSLPTVGFMVDMNRLYEQYIYQQLQVACQHKGFSLSAQTSIPFWRNRKIRPDMVLTIGDETMIIDTKWKILPTGIPPEEDLKQMFIYNHYFNASKGLLLYPRILNLKQESYSAPYLTLNGNPMHCDILFTSVLSSTFGLNRNLGYDILHWMQQKNS